MSSPIDNDTQNLLITACAEGFLDIVKFFFDNAKELGIDFNARGKGGNAFKKAIMR